MNMEPRTKRTNGANRANRKPKTPKTPKTPKVRVRKAESSLDHMAIVKDYAEGVISVKEIAQKHSTAENNVGLIANRFWKSLTNMRESRILTGTQGHFESASALKDLQSTDLINQEFLSLLSDSDTTLISEPESIYAWAYVHTGDPIESLEAAGLNKGLYKENKRDQRFSYTQALRYRAMYLNSKPNVISYIKELRERRLIDADVGRARIQSELIEQLESMKASPNISKHRASILRTIELLGKTVGAFVDRVEVTKVDPSNALDQLIEMAKEAEVRQIPEGDPNAA